MRCVVCSKREPEVPAVCGPDRWLMDLRLREVPVLAADLETPSYGERDARAKWVRQYDDDGNELHDERGNALIVLTDLPADPVAYWLTSGPVAGASREPRVAGSRERGVPARLDLLGPARRDADGLTDPHHDQVGSVSVAAILDSWCRDWITYDWCRADHLPVPTISELAGWLAVRLEDACDHHPAIDDFADELRDVHLALRSANGLTEPRPELCDGVPCRRMECDQKALYRIPGSPYVECGSCGLLYTESEYQEWVKLVASSTRRKGEAA